MRKAKGKRVRVFLFLDDIMILAGYAYLLLSKVIPDKLQIDRCFIDVQKQKYFVIVEK